MPITKAQLLQRLLTGDKWKDQELAPIDESDPGSASDVNKRRSYPAAFTWPWKILPDQIDQLRDGLNTVIQYVGDLGGIPGGAATGALQEIVVLAQLPADQWTDFPVPLTIVSYSEFEVFSDVGELLTDSFAYRKVDSTYQIHSLIAQTNLQINLTGA